MGRLLIAMAVIFHSVNTLAAADYPRLELDNGVMRVSILLPDAERGYYRGTRFDWSGIIERVEYDDHRFYAPLHPQHDPTRHDSVSGPVGEFAMFEPMGFAEAAPGEPFVKIGVGVLAKDDGSEYRFDSNYRLLRAGRWQIDSAADRVTFLQRLEAGHGWAYRYRKTIRLLPGRPELVIEQRLENRGAKTIDISYYNHNFTIIDDTPYGPDYSVEFPFATAEPRSLNDLAWFHGNRIQVEKALGDNSLWMPVYEGEGRVDYNGASVRNNRSGAAVEFVGDAPLTRMVFWAVERAACPEPFIRIHVAPGQAQQWSTRYLFSSDQAS